jgi:Zn-dependent protease
MPPLEPIDFLGILVIVLIAIGIHEFAHAKLADAAGDPTPRYYGRVTLNLFKHLDPIGTLMIIFTALAGVGIGWGKPVPMDPSKMRNPRTDHFIAVVAGPLSNLLQALVFALVLRAMALQAPLSLEDTMTRMLFIGVSVNISLFLFNLLPLGPLDGMWLLSAAMKDPGRTKWIRWNLTIGQFVFLGLVIFSQLNRGTPLDIVGNILRPLRENLLRLLLG